MVYSGCVEVWMVEAEANKAIKSNAHLDTTLDLEPELCYTKENSDSVEALDEESGAGMAVSSGTELIRGFLRKQNNAMKG